MPVIVVIVSLVFVFALVWWLELHSPDDSESGSNIGE